MVSGTGRRLILDVATSITARIAMSARHLRLHWGRAMSAKTRTHCCPQPNWLTMIPNPNSTGSKSGSVRHTAKQPR